MVCDYNEKVHIHHMMYGSYSILLFWCGCELVIQFPTIASQIYQTQELAILVETFSNIILILRMASDCCGRFSMEQSWTWVMNGKLLISVKLVDKQSVVVELPQNQDFVYTITCLQCTPILQKFILFFWVFFYLFIFNFNSKMNSRRI